MAAAWAAAQIGALLCASLLMVVSQLQPATAASRVCRQLEAELASARGGGRQGDQRKYDRAVAAQAEQIAIARRQARSAGCSFRILGGNAACDILHDRIGRMEANLAALQRKRAQLGSGTPRRNRLRILAELDANGCRGKPQPEVRPAPMVEARSVQGALPDDGSETIDDVAITAPVGDVRTVCVRICDGYFFPMSNASGPGDFERDQRNCEAACPGTEMRLYRQDEAGEAMMSTATGEPYSALPSAFAYKTEGVKPPVGCGCGAANNPAPAGIGPTASVPVPSLADKPGGSIIHLGTDGTEKAPEEKSPAPVPPTPAPQAEARPMDDRKVRVVGPTFLPAPEAAIDLRAPAPRRDP